MKINIKRILLSVTAMGSVTLTGAAVADDACEIRYRTTMWLNLSDFSPGPDTTLSQLIDGTTGAPILEVMAPSGGSLTKTLEISSGFGIKKIILCSSPSSPLPVESMSLVQPFPTPATIPLAFQYTSDKFPGCAVYAVNTGVGEWETPGVMPRISPTTLMIAVGSVPSGTITGVGARLQADPDSPVWSFVGDHHHEYLTGRGRGHNNTVAETSGANEDCEFMTPPNPDDFSDVYYEPGQADDDDHDDDDDSHKKDKKGKGKGKGKGKKKDD